MTSILFKIANHKYSFVTSLAISIALVLGGFALFQTEMLYSFELNFTVIGFVATLMPIMFITGYFGANKNVSNPFSIEKSLPLSYMLALLGLIAYFGQKVALYMGEIPISIDIIGIFLLIIGFYALGWRRYIVSWKKKIEN